MQCVSQQTDGSGVLKGRDNVGSCSFLCTVGDSRGLCLSIQKNHERYIGAQWGERKRESIKALIGPDLIQNRTSHNIRYSISCFLSLSPIFFPSYHKRTRERREAKRLMLRLEQSNSYSNWKSILSIFSHSFIVLLPERHLNQRRTQTGLSRNWTMLTTISVGRTFQPCTQSKGNNYAITFTSTPQ